MGLGGRAGEEMGDIIDDLKFQFFNSLLPSPQPSPRGTGTARAVTNIACEARERGVSAELQTALGC